MKFYLGVHQPAWLATAGVPLFVSYKRLWKYRTLPRSASEWALDSGAFTEISTHGEWRISAKEYAATVRRFHLEVGRMEWAAIQDWMCEPFITAKTGLTVEDHQRRTVDSLLELRTLEPHVPWAPVLQGWTVEDYARHREMYAVAGVDLRTEKIVGIGSVCRRNKTREIWQIAEAHRDLKMHGFGVKLPAVEVAAGYFTSTDSMAWSFDARRKPPLPGHTGHKNCANCLEAGMLWRAKLLARIADMERILS